MIHRDLKDVYCTFLLLSIYLFSIFVRVYVIFPTLHPVEKGSKYGP